MLQQLLLYVLIKDKPLHTGQIPQSETVHVLEAVSCWPGLLPVWPTYFHFPKQKHMGHLPLRPRLLVQMPRASLPCPSRTPRGELPGLLRFRLTDGPSLYVDVQCVAVRSVEFGSSVELWYKFFLFFFCYLALSVLFCYLDALSWASMRLKGWQRSKTTEWFWCTDIHGSQMNLTFLRRSWTFVDKCWEMLNMAAIIPAKHHRVNIVVVSTSGLTLEFRHCGWRLFISSLASVSLSVWSTLYVSCVGLICFDLDHKALSLTLGLHWVCKDVCEWEDYSFESECRDHAGSTAEIKAKSIML